MLKALIFDLDNTLALTERANYLAYKEACGKYGFKISEEGLLQAIRHSERWSEFVPRLTGCRDESVLKKIREAKVEIYPKYFDIVTPNKPLLELIELVREHAKGKIKLCVATTASRKNAENVLKKIGLEGKMTLVDGDSVSRQKPDPEIFLKAAELLGVKPEECLVFEDSPEGVEAAKKAGMHCVKIAF